MVFLVLIAGYTGRLIFYYFTEGVVCSSNVIFAFGECLQGKEPDIPGISEAVRMQL